MGTEVVLSCTVTGITQAISIVWKGVNNTTYNSSSTGDITVEDGEYTENEQITTLTIAGSANAADTIYTCEITSGFEDHIAKVINMNVFGMFTLVLLFICQILYFIN